MIVGSRRESDTSSCCRKDRRLLLESNHLSIYRPPRNKISPRVGRIQVAGPGCPARAQGGGRHGQGCLEQ